MIRDAYFSDDGRFRLVLLRVWDESLPRLAVVGLNPSTAGKEHDDPSMRKIVGFAIRHSYGSVVMVNLSDYCATDPRNLFAAGCPRSEHCDTHIVEAVRGRDTLVAWGSNTRREPMKARAASVLWMIRQHSPRVMALKVTTDGIPHHPLMIPYSARLTMFVG